MTEPLTREWLVNRRKVWEAEKVIAREDLDLKRCDRLQCLLRCATADSEIKALTEEINSWGGPP